MTVCLSHGKEWMREGVCMACSTNDPRLDVGPPLPRTVINEWRDPELLQRYDAGCSLRLLADEYSLSHEGVRAAIARARALQRAGGNDAAPLPLSSAEADTQDPRDAMIAELAGALEPFAREADSWLEIMRGRPLFIAQTDDEPTAEESIFTFDDLFRARSALASHAKAYGSRPTREGLQEKDGERT